MIVAEMQNASDMGSSLAKRIAADPSVDPTTSAYMCMLDEVVQRLERHESVLVEYVSTKSITASPHGVSQDKTVSLDRVVKVSAKSFALLFIASLVSWLYVDFPIVNPFVSLLGLVACPFFYAMGR